MSYFKAKMPANLISAGSAPDPAGGAYSAPSSWIYRSLLLREGGGRTGGKGKGEERVGEGKGRKEPYRHFFPPLRALVII